MIALQQNEVPPMTEDTPTLPPLPPHAQVLLKVYEMASRGKLTHRERAGHEDEIWRAIPNTFKAVVNPKKGGGLDPGTLMDLYAPFVKIRDVRNRRSLFIGGAAVEALWQIVDAEQEAMPIQTAARIWQKAKAIAATTSHTRTEAVQIALSEYERMPKVRLASGAVIHKPLTAIDKAVATATGSATERSKQEKKRRSKHGVRVAHGREVILNLRETLNSYFLQRVVEVGANPESPLVADALRNLGIEIDVLAKSMTLTVKRIAESVKSDAVAGVMVSTRRVNNAFRTLNMEPPGRGDEIDMDRVRQHKRRLAREYHPDTHGGKTDTVEKYNEVIEAFDVVEAWVAQNPGLVKGK